MKRRDHIRYLLGVAASFLFPIYGTKAWKGSTRVVFSHTYSVRIHNRHGDLTPFAETNQSNVYMRMDRLQSNGYTNSDKDLWIWYFKWIDRKGAVTFDSEGTVLHADLPKSFHISKGEKERSMHEQSVFLTVNTASDSFELSSTVELTEINSKQQLDIIIKTM